MKKFKSFSLIEMLMTLAIMSIVVLIATQTLNTIFRVSTISKFKTVTRNEISFSVELVERLLANSNVRDVYIFNSTPDQDIQQAPDRPFLFCLGGPCYKNSGQCRTRGRIPYFGALKARASRHTSMASHY